MIETAKTKLLEIGFTGLESDIYLFLITQGAHTGYGIAKGIGKAAANVYKGLDSLANKGALEHSMGDSKLFNAVPWRQLIRRQKARFEANINALDACLRQLPKPQEDEQVYQMRHLEQVKEKGLQLIENARHVLLADIPPQILEWFSTPLAEASARGVEVRVKLYQPADIPGVNLVIRENGQQVYGASNDINFSFCADGATMLLALLSSDKKRIIQAFRSKSALMCKALYNGLLHELIATELKQLIPRGELKKAQQLLQQTSHLHPMSTKNTVFEHFINRYTDFR